DEQSDVYSLGAVLYEILTGRPPFTDKNAVQMLVKIAKEPIPPVLGLAPGTPRELAFICERALEKIKKRRYASAAQLAAEIEPIWRIEVPSGIDAIAISRKGDWIAAASGDHSIKLFDPKAQLKRTLDGHEGKIAALAFSPDGSTLLSAGEDRQLLAWSVESG